MRVLLVEDDPLSAEFVLASLEDEGCDIAVEVDGNAGLRRARAESFDLLLLDIGLPYLRGDVLCEELRRAGVRAPIVAITATALHDEVTRLRTRGFDAVFTKPIGAATLRDLVRRYGGGGGR